MKLIRTFALAAGLAVVPAVAQAVPLEGQECTLFNDGGNLPEGTFQIVWPSEFPSPNGYMMPEGATGTLRYNYPWPCAPLPDVPVEPVPLHPVVEVATAEPPVPTAPTHADVQVSAPKVELLAANSSQVDPAVVMLIESILDTMGWRNW
jgi:hypothetical protein